MKRLVMTLVMACSPALAFAAPMTFIFDDVFATTSGVETILSEEGGDTVDISAYSPEDSDPLLGAAPAGLYIFTCDDPCYDNPQIDGWDAQEYVLVDFGKTVELTSVSFSYADADDAFTMLDGAGNIAVQDQSVGVGTGVYEISTYMFTSVIEGSQFYIGADSWMDDFKLYGISAVDISEVPVPAALWLMASGLAGLGFIRRRKTTQVVA